MWKSVHGSDEDRERCVCVWGGAHGRYTGVAKNAALYVMNIPYA